MMSGNKKSKEKEMAAFSKTYLTAYNGLQTVGWSYILFQTVKTLLKDQSVLGLWDVCGTSLLIFQSLAVLEVLHCVTGLVPSNAIITALQVGSRVFQAWGIIYSIEKVKTSPTLAVTLLAWGLTEVVRYSYYSLNLLGRSSSFLTWCRYTLFIGLYPAGVFGEVGNVFYALDTIKRTRLYSFAMPNPLNISFSFYYANIFLLLSYIPLFPQLFYHMVRQRRKVLGGAAKSKEVVKKAK